MGRRKKTKSENPYKTTVSVGFTITCIMIAIVYMTFVIADWMHPRSIAIHPSVGNDSTYPYDVGPPGPSGPTQ